MTVMGLSSMKDGMYSWMTCVEEIMKMAFEIEEASHAFYNVYSMCVRFTICKYDRKRDKDGVMRYIKWVCSRESFRGEQWLKLHRRRRTHKMVTRVDFEACFRIGYDPKSNLYVVREFVKEPSHLIASQKHVKFL